MSSKQTTNQSSTNQLNYDPSSLQNYGQLTGSGTSQLLGMMNQPFTNQLYTMGLGQSQKGAQQAGQNNMGVLQQMMKTSGLTGQAGQGFQAAQMGRIGRANQSMMAGANTSNVMQAMQRQMQATGMGMSFQPLLKGTSGTSQSTQTTGGLGTWLPQLIGSAAGMAMGNPMAAAGMMGGGGGPAGGIGGTQGMMGGGGFNGFSGFSGLGSAMGPAMPPPTWGMTGGPFG